MGNVAELGGWKIDDAPSMEWNEGSFWTLDLELPAGSDLEFKVSPTRQILPRYDKCWHSQNSFVNNLLQILLAMPRIV